MGAVDLHPAPSGALLNPADALAYMLGGNAVVALRSNASGHVYTYRVRQFEDGRGGTAYAVYLEDDGSILFGLLDHHKVGHRGGGFRYHRHAHLPRDNQAVKIFGWLWARVATGYPITGGQLTHQGLCGTCEGPLTEEEQARGFDAECWAKILERVDLAPARAVHHGTQLSAGNCRSCGADIWWLTPKSSKRQILDRAPSYVIPGEGRTVLITLSGKVVRGRTAEQGAPGAVMGYVSHWATCPHAKQHRKGGA